MRKIIKRNFHFSACKRYRWSLDLVVSEKKKDLIFIGLNPSLSDYDFLDNTTKKIIRISEKYNYGKIKLINLFGLISRSPELLLKHNDPIGNLNNYIIDLSLKYWSKSIYCDLWVGWGNKGSLFKRDQEIKNVLKKYTLIKKKTFNKPVYPLTIKKTKSNHPVHPLYCLDNSELKEFY